MCGVGRVFELFRNNVLTYDDEVAVVHGPEEVGYVGSTTPLVDMRATLHQALTALTIDSVLHDELLGAAQSLPYWHSTYSKLFSLHAHVSASVQTWIVAHPVQQKRADAIKMLEEMPNVADRPKRVQFCFHHSTAFENLISETHDRATDNGERRSVDSDACLDEVRLLPQLSHQIFDRADSGCAHRRCLLVDNWLDKLQVLGVAEELQRRARDKRQSLHNQFGGLPTYADVMLTPAVVFDWYFEQCNGVHVPPDVECYARAQGYTGVESYVVVRVLVRKRNRRCALALQQARNNGNFVVCPWHPFLGVLPT